MAWYIDNGGKGSVQQNYTRLQKKTNIRIKTIQNKQQKKEINDKFTTAHHPIVHGNQDCNCYLMFWSFFVIWPRVSFPCILRFIRENCESTRNAPLPHVDGTRPSRKLVSAVCSACARTLSMADLLCSFIHRKFTYFILQFSLCVSSQPTYIPPECVCVRFLLLFCAINLLPVYLPSHLVELFSRNLFFIHVLAFAKYHSTIFILPFVLANSSKKYLVLVCWLRGSGIWNVNKRRTANEGGRESERERERERVSPSPSSSSELE